MRRIRIQTVVKAAALATVWSGLGAPGVGAMALADERSASLSAADKKFLDDAYSINQGEIMLGFLAQQNGASPSVKSLGQHMVQDHSQALNAERQVALKAQVTLPADVDAATHAQYDDLSKRSGPDFDVAYGDAMVSGHEQALRKFGDEATSGTNAAIKAYAQSQLPTLRDHLRMSRQVAESLRPGVAEPQRP
jgi:putative membrane protein